METNLKDFPATVLVHTINGAIPACDMHANTIIEIYEALGAHVNKTPLLEPTHCVNCINEGLRKAKQAP